MFDPAETPIQEVMAAAVASVGAALDRLDTAALDGPAAVELFEVFDRAARLAAAGRALCAARIEETDAWRGQGHRDAAGFLAARMGAFRADAKDALAVGARARGAAEFGAAVRSGRLSEAQAAEIAETLGARPESEAELLGAAQTATMRELRAACAEVASRGAGADERHARAQEQRFCQSGVGRDGQWRLNAGLTTLDGALVDKALDLFQNEAFDEARAAGAREPFTAYRADALVRMATAALAGGVSAPDDVLDDLFGDDTPGEREQSGEAVSSPSGPRRRRRRRRGRPRARSSTIRHAIVVTVPHTTFLTGRPADDGEVCRVPGVGPVPVAAVRELLRDDPIVKCVVTNGRDITATATMTRTIKDDLRLAVLHAHDWSCAVPGCDATRFLELDHEHQFARHGPTSYDNLRPLCGPHHDQRTNEGYELMGRPGNYRWVAPDGRVLSADAAPIDPGPPCSSAPEPGCLSDLTAEHSPEHDHAPA